MQIRDSKRNGNFYVRELSIIWSYQGREVEAKNDEEKSKKPCLIYSTCKSASHPPLAIIPPSTLIYSPEMKDAPSLARNEAT